MRVRVYKSPDGKGKVLNKTAQWMATGGITAVQQAQNQGVDEQTESQVVNLIVPMINEEPSTILNYLVNSKNIPQEIAQPILMKVLEYKQQKEEADAAAMKDNPEEVEDVAAEEKAIQQESMNDVLVQQMMIQPDNSQEDYAAEDQSFVDNTLMARNGGISKKKFIKNTTKLLKKQLGDEVQETNTADDTDTGERQDRMSSFISTLQNQANNALIKEDAENLYNAQYMKRGGQSRQERIVNRGLNQIVRNMPVGIMPGMIPQMGVIGAQNIMNAMGSQIPTMPSPIKTANIEVKRTGLFGRPKEWSASLTYNDQFDPRILQYIREQEIYNSQNRTKEDAEEYAQERVNTSTTDNAAVKEETEKKEGTDAPVDAKPAAPGITPTPKKEVNKVINTKDNRSVKITPETPQVPEGDWLSRIQAAWNSPEMQAELAAEQAAKEATGSYLEGWWNENILPTINPNAAKKLQQPQRKNTNLYVLESKPGYYYRMRNDGSYERFKGDPNKHTTSKKSSGIVTTSDPNYSYLNKNKKYALTYKPTKQFGGFADSSTPELNKFVYGGREPMSFADEVPMQNTADPFFKYGGLTTYQDKGEVNALTPEELALAKQLNINDLGFSPDETRSKIKQMQREQWIDQQMQAGNLPVRDNLTPRQGEPGYEPGYSLEELVYNNPYYNNIYTGGYGFPIMNQQAPIYPPAFGGRRFRPSNRAIEYAGSWIQQQGLPTYAGTNTPYMGSLAGLRPTKISGENRWLRPDKWSIEFEVPGAAPATGSSIANFPTSRRFYTDTEGNIQDLRPENVQQPNQRGIAGSFGPRSDEYMQNLWQRRAQRRGYDVDWSTDGFVSPNKPTLLPPPQYTDSELGIDQIVDVQPETFNMSDLQSMGYNITPEDFYNERLANENQAARQEFELNQLRRRQDGGDSNIDMAQFGKSDCPDGYFRDSKTGRCINFAGEYYMPSATLPSAESLMTNPFEYQGKNPFTGDESGVRMGYNDQYVNEGLLGEKGDDNSGQTSQKLKAEFKEKRMFNVNPLQALNVINARGNQLAGLANYASGLPGVEQYYMNLAHDSEQAKNTLDMGDHIIGGSGEFRPNQQGQVRSSKTGGEKYKQGGVIYKKGGVTYMNSKQIQEFMKKGGKIEFIK